ncbi:hypothetical protein [uncultured Umboniibacter sp.]|uniref:hypothetical protein n=1 Tax=uncultured Umboniibacter sp. TaxID=1798917 RepID=UPI00260CEAC2|nr:hypothetical protein [uncultured Umboniibacter sp.]
MVNKTIYIHVGPGKTGTSAIQYWLNSHRDLLKSEFGVWYPAHAIDSNGVSDGNRAELLSIDEQGEFKVDAAKIQRLIAQFEASNYRSLVFSSERFYRHIPELARLLPQARFVFYVRNQIEIFESNYNQSVKRHGQFKPIDTERAVRFRVLRQVGELINKGLLPQLDLRPYGAELFSGGNLVTDFLSAIDVNVSVEDRGVNHSYSFEALEFKRAANYFCSPELSVEVDRACQAIAADAEGYSLLNEQTHRLLSNNLAAELKKFVERYNQPQLLPLAEFIATKRPMKYCEQDSADVDFRSICRLIQKHDAALYKRLQREFMSSPLKGFVVQGFSRALGLMDVDSVAKQGPDCESTEVLLAQSKAYLANAELRNARKPLEQILSRNRYHKEARKLLFKYYPLPQARGRDKLSRYTRRVGRKLKRLIVKRNGI